MAKYYFYSIFKNTNIATTAVLSYNIIYPNMDILKTHPDELKKAYLQTDYSFTDGDSTLVIRLDQENPELLAYLELEQISSWAYLTAWNPSSIQQTDEFNHSQQQVLLEKLMGYKTCKGEGKGRDGNWPAEESYFVAGISREKAIELGWNFGQKAILVSGKDLEPELVFSYGKLLNK